MALQDQSPSQMDEIKVESKQALTTIKDELASINVNGNVPDTTELDTWIRGTWKEGSYCEVHSQTIGAWTKARIIKIYNDAQGEWLQIQYTAGDEKRHRECSRYDSTAIRPVQRALKIYEYTYNAMYPNKKPFGQMQSPINIVTAKSGKNKHITVSDTEFQRNPLQFNYPSTVKNCTILNNGHTVQINIDASNKCMVSIHDKSYELKQFHFHTPSEHTVDSETYEMEMHLVHVNAESEIAVLGFMFSSKSYFKRARPKLQLTKSRGHLFIAKPEKMTKSAEALTPKTTIKEENEDDEEWKDWDGGSDLSTDEDDEDDTAAAVKDDGKGKTLSTGNDFLDQFWSQLPREKTTEDIPLNKDISFDSLFEMASNNFIKTVKTNEMNIDMEIFEYQGSLTTPPYTEGVQWLLSRKIHFMNKSEVYTMSSCWNHECNARPVQQYFGRTVSLRCKSSLLLND